MFVANTSSADKNRYLQLLRPNSETLTRAFNSDGYIFASGCNGVKLIPNNNYSNNNINNNNNITEFLPIDLENQCINAVENMFISLKKVNIPSINLIQILIFVKDFNDAEIANEIIKKRLIGKTNAIPSCVVVVFNDKRLKVTIEFVAQFKKVGSRL
ncbi:hypothetical protein B5S28_g4747 [[Candida] boidinii]|nr:hypothetical protein B5S28_g4747 [[Candida] boidinii]OWB63159.1 hypothetical protein B5S29_g4116 [[Candida] boidinii]OWB73379.1 hypothetical protein B5S31_g3118 [[Candida] boidinii]OWB78550.1 hypothetical protein B5S32_g2746 [[Candida] boidinii]GMF02799.1 unnamed protein product [[Candida] boidinii]